MRLLRGIDDALSTARNNPGRDRGSQQRLPLPGVDGSERPTVAPEAPQSRQGSLPHTSVRAREGKAPAGFGGQRREQSGRAAAQDERAPEPVVPGVQPLPPSGRSAGYAGATVPSAEVERAALTKAQERDWWRLVSYQPDQGSWYVPSRTTPGEFYVVRVRAGSEKGHPPWWRLTCNCPAETSGKFLACWHKYAVWLRFQRPASGRSGDTRRGSER